MSLADQLEIDASLHRTFQDAGNRRILTSGFIGRRTELHEARRRLRQGQRIFIFHGLGGLGKTTFSVRLLSMLGQPDDVCAIWCQELASAPDPAGALVSLILDFARMRYGVDAEELTLSLDRHFPDDILRRCLGVLDFLVAQTRNLVFYLDNVESLLAGPEHENVSVGFAEWRVPQLLTVWNSLLSYAENTSMMRLVVSTRYVNGSMPIRYHFPVSPLGPGAIFRLTRWFPALRRLSGATRERLVERLSGHPRAVELADGLIEHMLEEWEITYELGSDLKVTQEWDRLVAPVLPNVQGRLESDLLLDAIWERVLDDAARRMLFRMSLAHYADRWQWTALVLFGDGDSVDENRPAVYKIIRTSLLVVFQIRIPDQKVAQYHRYYGLHPSTIAYVSNRFAGQADLRSAAHRRIGQLLASLIKVEGSKKEQCILALEGGYHLFQVGEYDHAARVSYEAATRFLLLGQPRRTIDVLVPFLEEPVRSMLTPSTASRVFDGLARGYRNLEDFDRAVAFQQSSVDAARSTGDTVELRAAMGNLGNLYFVMKQYGQAVENIKEALDLARACNDRNGEMFQIGNLGAAHMEMGNLDQAQYYLEEAYNLSQELGGINAEDYLANLGSLNGHRNQIDKAIDYYEQAIQLARDHEKPISEEKTLRNLSKVLLDSDQIDRAIEVLNQSVQTSHRIGDRKLESLNLVSLAKAYHRTKRWAAAIEKYQQALRLSRESGERGKAANHLFCIGLIYYEHRDWGRAAENFEQGAITALTISDYDMAMICYAMLGDSYNEKGQFAVQVKAYEKALSLAQAASLPEREIKYLTNLGASYFHVGDTTRAFRYFNDAVSVCRRGLDCANFITPLNNLAATYVKLGQIDQAMTTYEQRLTACRDAKDILGERNTLGNLCRLSLEHVRPQAYSAYLRQLVELERRSGERILEKQAILALGSHYAEREEWSDAVVYFGQALELARGLNDRKGERECLAFLGTAHRNAGDPQKEIECLEQLLPMDFETGDHALHCKTLGNLGRAHLSMSHHDLALNYLEQAVLAGKNLGDPNRTISPLINLGGVLIEFERWDRAAECLEEAVRLANKTGNRNAEASALGNLGIVYSSRGESLRAKEILNSALLIAQETNNRQLLQIVTHYLNQLSSSALNE